MGCSYESTCDVKEAQMRQMPLDVVAAQTQETPSVSVVQIPQVAHDPQPSMTLHEWRTNGDLLALAAVVLEQPAVMQMLSVLEGDDPSNNPKLIKDGAGAMYEIGLIYGWKGALAALRSMREPLPKKQEDIKASWGVTEE